VDAQIENEPGKSLVIGSTGLVGGCIVEHLLRRSVRPLVLSRSQRDRPGIDWIRGDLTRPDMLKLPPFATLSAPPTPSCWRTPCPGFSTRP